MRFVHALGRCLAWASLLLTPFSWVQAVDGLPIQPTAPVITQVEPAPGLVNALSSVAVTFSEPVAGVRAGDFLVNGVPAQTVSGSGSEYRFSFSQPAYGPVDISWGTLHTIVNLEVPPQRFDAGVPGSTWAYQLIDAAGPTVASVLPVPGTTLRQLGAVEVAFNGPVFGIQPADLRLNGRGATNLTGVGAGPYRFSFAPAPAGVATLDWRPDHGIVADDVMALAFKGAPWTYTVDPGQAVPDVIINEIMAENQTGLRDEDQDPEDWIELFNRGTQPVNLGGWSLSVDREDDAQWTFPSTTIPAKGYLLVWASGKDRRNPAANQRFHTSFKLNPTGDALRLLGPELPRTVANELSYPKQSADHSYGRQDGSASCQYYAVPSPAGANGITTITGRVDEVHFSVKRGFFNAPFTLSLACPTREAQIRFTLDGSPPNATNGAVYTTSIAVTNTRVVRAAAFAPQLLPSDVRTHTYLLNVPNNRRLLPVLSLVTATNNLYGRTGIMEFNPRNTTKHGAAWERPVSVEWLRPEDNDGFHLDAGMRVAGGDYIRQLYNYRTTAPPAGKYSFRLYFRGEYGPGRLQYPLFPNSTVESFNSLHLRAGMNDSTNPFIKDEFVRQLTLDVGISACHGTFVHLFLNGVYKGLYNPCERVDDDFLQAYHGGGELWDVMGPNNAPLRGDSTAWNQLRSAARKDLTVLTNYLDVAGRMDLSNFIDYLLPLIWADNDDWPHNNTRAAREKKPGARFRFYPWDAEFSFTSHTATYDTIANTLSSMHPLWGTTDYQAMFNSLKKSPEFSLLFADRVHRAFFNDGPLTDARIRAHYNAVKALAAPSIPGFNDVIGNWIGARRKYLTNIFQKAGFLASSNAPAASPSGGLAAIGQRITLQNGAGSIFYTTNGADPRVPFTSIAHTAAIEYAGPLTLKGPLHLLARSLAGTNWSALADLTFQAAQVGSPVRIAEIMSNPPGGDAFEFIELQNTGALPVNLSGSSFEGIHFRFPTDFPELGPGDRIVLANSAQPIEFERRYPRVSVAGWYTGSLANHGERIGLLDSSGALLTAVEFSDQPPWPACDAGASLELIDLAGDPNSPANWQSSAPGGSPGAANLMRPTPAVVLNELQAGTDQDWLELYNPGAASISLAGWSLTDNSDPRQFVFPAGSSISSGSFLHLSSDATGSQTAALPFHLDRNGETIALFDPATNRVDAVRYGPVIDGPTVGLIQGRWVLCEPTPAAPNQAAVLGALSALRINEFLANHEGGDDWIELFNLGDAPASLQGCALLTSNAVARISAPTFIGPRNFLVLHADDKAAPGHLELKLPADGGLISLRAATGDELDRVVYVAQSTGISSGRLPDGVGSFAQLPFTPTPGSSNYLAQLGTPVRISELMARSSAGVDWVELENVSTSAVSLVGYSLVVAGPDYPPLRWPLQVSAKLNPSQQLLLYFGTLPAGFAPAADSQIFSVPLPEQGAILSLEDSQGRLVDQVAYGPQVINRSIGRVNQGWHLLTEPSPGRANGTAAELDPGTGLRINEWLAGGSGTNDFIELFNPAGLPVHLGGWVLTDDPSIHGSTNNPIPPLSFIGPHSLLQVHTDGQQQHGLERTSFQLDSFGETIRLLNANGVVIDTVDFGVQRNGVSEGRYPDGAPLVVRFPGSVSPGLPNYLRPGDTDGDGLDDVWELLHGLDPESPDDAALDTDADGLSNLQEFLAGTDPLDASSSLRLDISYSTLAPSPVIRFVAQTSRAYSVDYSDATADLSWHVLSTIPPSQTTAAIEVRDTTPASDRPTRLYRVRLTP